MTNLGAMLTYQVYKSNKTGVKMLFFEHLWPCLSAQNIRPEILGAPQVYLIVRDMHMAHTNAFMYIINYTHTVYRSTILIDQSCIVGSRHIGNLCIQMYH